MAVLAIIIARCHFTNLSVVLVILTWLNVEVESFASDGLVDGEHVPRGRLKVARRIVALRDIEGLFSGVVDGLVDIAHADEHLEERAEEGQGGLDLSLGIVRLNGCRDDGDAQALGANCVRRRNHRNVDI